MDGGGAERSARARMRERREERARRREDILDLVVSGYSYATIADTLKLGVKTVRRARAAAARPAGAAHGRNRDRKRRPSR